MKKLIEWVAGTLVVSALFWALVTGVTSGWGVVLDTVTSPFGNINWPSGTARQPGETAQQCESRETFEDQDWFLRKSAEALEAAFLNPGASAHIEREVNERRSDIRERCSEPHPSDR